MCAVTCVAARSASVAVASQVTNIPNHPMGCGRSWRQRTVVLSSRASTPKSTGRSKGTTMSPERSAYSCLGAGLATRVTGSGGGRLDGGCTRARGGSGGGCERGRAGLAKRASARIA
jgi:hypothetical protein